MWVMRATWAAAFCNRPGIDAGSSTIRVKVASADSLELFVDRTPFDRLRFPSTPPRQFHIRSLPKAFCGWREPLP
jgi:hypothetical protein